MTASSPIRQRRRLIRARDLAVFRQALAELALEGSPIDARRRAVILPTRAAIELFRQTLERAAAVAGRAAIILPDCLTRDEWMTRLADAAPDAGPLLGRPERELLLERAALRAQARARMPGPPFAIRPGLVSEMLDLYDELRRRQRTVRRFTRALFEQLRVERGTDRGSESLIHQTAFLGLTFLGYERAVAASGAADEHVIRRGLLAAQPHLPFDHLVVAVADRPSDPRGLWPADFDLAGRLRGIGAIDVVVTDETHDAGFRERIERELPGIEEARQAGEPRTPRLVRPPGDAADAICLVSRDREEELRDVARVIRERSARTAGALAASTAIVFHRPLPYLYLAQQVLADARVPFQAFDALPLGAEPYAALLDLVLAAARTGGTREASVSLLRSPLLAFETDGAPVTASDAAALDAVLAEQRATGEADTYGREIEGFARARRTVDRALMAKAVRGAGAAAAIRESLLPYRTGDAASAQVAAVSRFLRRHERAPESGDESHERYTRARAAVLGVLDELVEAFRRHADGRRPHEELTALIHHAIEARVFAPARGRQGVHVVDAVSARFGEFDHVHLVGLVETDWPARPRRSIFYTTGLLEPLGWPQERDQMRADQAAFRDLLRLPAGTIRLHAFQLDGDNIVGLSPMLDEARALPSERDEGGRRRAIFADELLTLRPPRAETLGPDAMEWLSLRSARPPLTDRAYGGFVGARAPRSYRVSKVDRYVDCPFKYFAESVLQLPEERDEAAGLTPLERGTLLHELFEQFYRIWQQEHGGAITPATLPAALELFGGLAREALAGLPEADRALEETRLLGSIVARGVGERVFELEADAGRNVVERLLEFDLRGPFNFPELLGLRQRSVEIRGKADRVDVLDDGSLRVIDYKLGRLPDLDWSVQVAVYAHAVRQALERRDGRPHPIQAAMYLAFGDERHFEGALGGQSKAAAAVEARASEFAKTIARIEDGEFPASPRRPGDCQWCAFAGVCRKEYLAEDDAAESV